MSDSIVAALIAGFVSLLVASVTGFFAEAYRRHKDAQALAAGLAGELASYAEYIPRIMKNWQGRADIARKGVPLELPKIKYQDSSFYEGNVGKLGLLGAKLAEDVVNVYSNVKAFRQFLTVAAEAIDAAQQESAIREALAAVGRAKRRGASLVERLQKRASAKFLRPVS